MKRRFEKRRIRRIVEDQAKWDRRWRDSHDALERAAYWDDIAWLDAPLATHDEILGKVYPDKEIPWSALGA